MLYAHTRAYLHVRVCGCLVESSAGGSSGLMFVLHLLTQVEQTLGAVCGINKYLPATLEGDDIYTF